MVTIIWLVLTVLFLLAEASTVTLISLWFAAGSVTAMIAGLLGAPVWLQITLFFAVSAALLASLRGLVKKHLNPRLTATNVDAVVGARGYVTGDVDNLKATGSVKLGAMEWTARSATGEAIPAGTLVKVERIEGVKAFVTPVEIPAETQSV